MRAVTAGIILATLATVPLAGCGKSPSTAERSPGTSTEGRQPAPAMSDREAKPVPSVPAPDAMASNKSQASAKGPFSLSLGNDGQSVLQSVVVRQD